VCNFFSLLQGQQNFSKVAFLFFLSIFLPKLQEAKAYKYSLPMQRDFLSPKSLALSGATVANPENERALFYNPAAIVFQNSLFTIYGSAFGKRKSEPEFSSANKSIEMKDYSGEIQGRPLGWLGFGLGIRLLEMGFESSQPFSSGNAGGAEHRKLRLGVNEFPFAFALRPFDTLSVGVSISPKRVLIEKLSGQTYPAEEVAASQKFAGQTYSLGLLYAASQELSLGLHYKFESVLKSTQVQGSSTSTADGFVIPSKLDLGAAFFVNTSAANSQWLNSSTLFAQGTFFPAFNNNKFQRVHPASVLSESAPTSLGSSDLNLKDFEIVNRLVFVPRVGVDTSVFESENIGAHSLLGAYYETQSVSQSKSLFHFTAGLDLKVYFVNAGVGLDFYSNTVDLNFGLGYLVSL
jgi:hypothetical protein